jgi:predicted transcriptional regulator
MEDVLERHYAVREMVKDLSLKTKVIAEKTGYNQSYVSELRRRHLDAEASKARRLKEQEDKERKEQARIDGLIAKAVAKERESICRIIDTAQIPKTEAERIKKMIKERV